MPLSEHDILRRRLAAMAKEWHDFDNPRPRRANRLHDEVVKLCRGVYQSEGQLRDLLLPLLSDADHRVRGVAAWMLLWEEPKAAAAVLEENARIPGFEGFTAEMTLKEWRAGRLRPLYKADDSAPKRDPQ